MANPSWNRIIYDPLNVRTRNAPDLPPRPARALAGQLRANGDGPGQHRAGARAGACAAGQEGEVKVCPLTIKRANQIVREWHRHNKPTQGGRFALGAIHENELVAVAIVGRPLARMLAGEDIAEVTRVCTTDAAPRNACSFMYGACRRVWFSMGGTRLITYTLKSESGASLRGAGWIPTAETAGGQQWGRTSRPRGDQEIVAQVKIRWETIELGL